MDGSLLGRFLQRPQSSDSGMDFQFMPGPSSKGQKPVHKKGTSLDVGSQQSVDQTAKKQGAVAMMPPPLIPSQTIRDPCKEGAGSWESQNMSSSAVHHHRQSLPQQEHTAIPSDSKSRQRKRSNTMNVTTSAFHSSHSYPEDIQSRDSTDNFGFDNAPIVQMKQLADTTPPDANIGQWGHGLLDMDFELPKDTPSSAQKRNSSVISSPSEIHGPKRMQSRPLEFYETPLAKQVEAQLNQLNHNQAVEFSAGDKKPEIIDLSDDDEPATFPDLRQDEKSLHSPFADSPGSFYPDRGLAQRGVQRGSKAERAPYPSHENNKSHTMDFPDFGEVNYPSKQPAPLDQSSGLKMRNLIQQHQHKLKETQRQRECHNRGLGRRTLSVHSSQGPSTPQPSRPPNVQVLQSSKALQKVMNDPSSVSNSLMPAITPMSGEQQLSIALTHLAAEKITLEKKLNQANQDSLVQGAELLTLKKQNQELNDQNERYKSAISSLKVQVSNIKEHVKVSRGNLIQLGEESASFRNRIKDCVVEGMNIKKEVQRTYENVTNIGDKVGMVGESAYLAKDMKMKRDSALETIEVLRLQLSDNVGELALARARVSELEAMLEKAAQRTLEGAGGVREVTEFLTGIKIDCTSGFQDLQRLLNYVLDPENGVMVQKRDIYEILTRLVRSEGEEMTKKLSSLEKVLRGTKQEMSKSEKRIRRVAINGGTRMMDKVVNATDALEKLFQIESNRIMETLKNCVTISKDLQENSSQQPEIIDTIRSNVQSMSEKIISLLSETREIHDIAINDRKYISHIVGNTESLSEKLKLLESRSGELEMDKVQLEKKLQDSLELGKRMTQELLELRKLEKETRKSNNYLEEQLESALAQPKEDPATSTIISGLRSNVEMLEKTEEALRATLAEREQQSILRDHQFDELQAKFLSLKEINDELKEQLGRFDGGKNEYESEKARYLKEALKQRDEERIAVEKNAQRLCDRIRVESQNSMKMLTDVNTKLLNDVSSSKAKITEYDKELSELHTQLVHLKSLHMGVEMELECMRKVLAEQAEEQKRNISALQSEKAALESNLEAARDLVRNLESELDALRTSNCEEKLNQAELEVFGLKRDIDQMKNRVELGSTSLNSALKTVYTRKERMDMNRSLEDAIAEVQSLCEEINLQSGRKFIESGTCMEVQQLQAQNNDIFLQIPNTEVSVVMDNKEAIVKQLKQVGEENDSNKNLSTTEFPDNTTLVKRTPSPDEQKVPSLADSSTIEQQATTSRGLIRQIQNGMMKSQDCIPATQVPMTKVKGKKAESPPHTPSKPSVRQEKTLQMSLITSSPQAYAKSKLNSPTERSSMTANESGTVVQSTSSPVISRKRLRNDTLDAPHIKVPEPRLITPTQARRVIPPVQPRAKRPRYERPAVTKSEVIVNSESEVEKDSMVPTISGKDVKRPPATPPSQIRESTPPIAGPKRKRAPTKRGVK